MKTMKDEQWTTKEGVKILVGDMTENHAKNCLRLMIRKHNIRKTIEKERAKLEGCDATEADLY